MKTGIFVWMCLTVLQVADSENIAFFFGVSSYSHRIPAWPLAEALADKGHNVTFVSPYPAKNPNPKIFDFVPKRLKEWVDSWGDLDNVFGDRKKGDWISGWSMLPTYGIMMCEEIYKDVEYIDWVRSTKVDVVVLDVLANDCAYGMAHYWDAKVILFDTTNPFSHFTEAYGLPDETSWIPSMELFYPLDMSFSQRLVNTLVPLATHFHRKFNFYPALEAITGDKLGIANVPKFEELERNTSLVFVNTHFAEEFSRSLPPNVIPVGGIACTGRRKSLPKEMESFLGKGDGFIYVSFGTYADFLKFDAPVQQAFIGAMQNLTQIQFLWKKESDKFINEFPKKNVFVSSWMPQQDILAHPKIRAFVTHAGLLGIQEAIYNSVPLISFPIFADQDYNAERIHRKEYGIRLEITTVTQPQIEDAIHKILTDEKYHRNMKKVSTMFTDRPQTPLDTALWWTDFVMRHSKEDLAALRPASVGQDWWKRRQLDVWTALVASIAPVLTLFGYFVYWLLKCTFNFIRSSNTTKVKGSSVTTRRKKFE